MSSTQGSGVTSSHHHHHHHHSGRRLRQFLRPDGRRVHIAHSPEEAVRLQRHLESSKEPFDLYIHGSPEHLEALREVHGHHERRREALREKHGDAYDEFEKVRLELDALSNELRAITEHGVALDANFSKYGYSAHLRTRAEPESSTTSILSEGTSDHHDWEAERTTGYTLKFYRKPVVRQYFHKGLLWRAPESEEVASFELFVDLLYVGIIEVNGESAAEHPSGAALLRFCITFILGWKIWTDFTLTISWFESDDIVQRISVLFVLACLVGYTTNILEMGHHTYTQMIAFFLAARFFGGLYYLWLSFTVPMIRPVLVGNAIVVFVACALWIGSIHVEEPSRQALIWMAIAVDLWGALLILVLHRGSKHISESFGERMARLFEFFPAVNIEHKTERTNAFVTLVFGASVLALLFQNKADMSINAFYGKAVLGLIQAFSFNWIYFEIDGVNIYMHAIRRKIWSSILWNSIHLPFIMSYVLGAAALSKLVIAHDSSNSDPHTLTSHWEHRSIGEIPLAIRWFYCAGLGLALACMGLISMTHIHKDIVGARLFKRYRLAFRFAVSVVLLCLPTVERLNSLQLISTVTGLVLCVLIVDLYGLSNTRISLFSRTGRCAYTAECPMRRKDIEHTIKTGETIKVEELVNNDKKTGHKGLYELS